MRETVGKIATDLKQKSADINHNPHEQMQESLTEYETSLLECLDSAKRTFPTGDIFLVVITKKERLLDNVLRNYFLSRRTCPTPDYDQTVYHYKRHDDQLEFLWTIPAKDICIEMMTYPKEVHPEERELFGYINEFASGELFIKAKKLNGEEIDSPFLVKG